MTFEELKQHYIKLFADYELMVKKDVYPNWVLPSDHPYLEHRKILWAIEEAADQPKEST